MKDKLSELISNGYFACFIVTMFLIGIFMFCYNLDTSRKMDIQKQYIVVEESSDRPDHFYIFADRDTGILYYFELKKGAFRNLGPVYGPDKLPMKIDIGGDSDE